MTAATTPQWQRTGAAGDLASWRTGEVGPVVAAAHGMEDTWRSWSALADRLPGHRLHALDLPWRAGGDYRWRAEGTPGEWLGRALDLVPEPVDVLLGHSFGANAVLEHLAAGAAAPRAVVLLAPFYRPRSAAEGDDLRARSHAGFVDIIGDGLRLKLGPRAGKLDADLVAAMQDTLVKRVVPVAFPVFYDCFVRSGVLDLTGVGAPTLVLAGTEDQALAGERAVALAADMPAADVRPDPGYSHFCHVEQAARVAAELAAFLADHLPAPEPAGSG